MTEINLNDVQGFILRGYRIDVARFFVLKINDAGAAKKFLGGIVSGDQTFPQITTAEDWGPTKPDYCLNIGITFEGLTTLQLAAKLLVIISSIISIRRYFADDCAGRRRYWRERPCRTGQEDCRTQRRYT